MRVWHCACCELLSINRPHECGRAFGGRGRDATRVAWTGGPLACLCCELLAINSHHECGRALGGHDRTAGTQPGLRGQAVNTRTLINRIARVANSVPLRASRLLSSIAWARLARANTPARHGHRQRLEPGHGARTRGVIRLQGTGLRWTSTRFCVCRERNWLACCLPTRNAWPD